MRAKADFSLHATLDQIAGRVRVPGDWSGEGEPAISADHTASPSQAAELWPIDLPAFQFLGSAAPFVKPLWGPNTGYAWAITRLSVFGLAGADAMLIYRGFSGAADVQPQNIVAPPLTVTAPTFNPGKTGLILMPEQALVIGGTLTGASTYTVSGNAIQVTLDRLSRFLE
jgi:hypothetical protein